MRRRLRLKTATISALVLLIGIAAPAGADSKGYVEAPFGVGYFYGTFGESPDVVLTVGGTAEDFCDVVASDPEIDDPFNAEPGESTVRIFERNDGSVDLKVNDKGQPIHLYFSTVGDAPIWINKVCDGEVEPNLFASGTADLKVRISVISEDLVDVFNSVNGKAVGTDGTEYKVRASADLSVENGMPVGDPEDFVDFNLQEIRR